jgi:hypothetical protein
VDNHIPHQFVVADALGIHKGLQQMNGRDGHNGGRDFLFE